MGSHLVSLLGPTTVHGDRGPIVLRPSARRTLLELLAAHAGEPVPVELIVAQLWPEAVPERPADAVRSLMRGFGALRVRSTVEGPLLDIPPESVDALHMVALADQARTIDDDTAVRTLEHALALWRGEPFGGTPTGPHLADVARTWHETWSSALRSWAGAQLRLGRPGPVIDRLRAQRVGDFADEELYTLLIRALSQLGDKAAADWRPDHRGGGSRR